ncbi:hypothetical protein SUGI_0901680 [Cryptomeria japonica]|nr:hypothetical protein SUGI_0901680 [Cryptomeria japonica]
MQTSLVPKASFVIVFIILLTSNVSMAKRPLQPEKSNASGASTEIKGKEVESTIYGEEDCYNIDEEECLMRRTLSAHTDYIYTLQHGQP